MSSNRHWMYARIKDGLVSREYIDGLETFIQFATSQHRWMDGEKIRCPCNQRRCQNTKFLDVATVKYHLAKFGFIPNYYVWIFQGESDVRVDVDREVGGSSSMASEEASSAYHTMVMDAAGPEFNVEEIEESPNPEAQKFYDMLKAADQELWPGCQKHSQLSLVARLMSLKSENSMSEKCFNQITELMKEIVPEDNLVTDNFYNTKKLLRGMGLPVEKIDCCKNNCMIYWCSRHTGGSRSAIEHYQQLRNELSHEPDLFQCFERTHVKKNGTYVDERSKKIAEEVQARVVTATQEVGESSEPPNMDMSKLYVDVAGGIKKQHIYGIGTKASSFIASNASCKSSATSHFDQDALRKEIEEQIEARVEARVEARLAQVDARVQAEVDSRVQSLLEELRRHGVLPTSMQPPTTPTDSSTGMDGANLRDD